MYIRTWSFHLAPYRAVEHAGFLRNENKNKKISGLRIFLKKEVLTISNLHLSLIYWQQSTYL